MKNVGQTSELRLGTRGSNLALMQSALIARQLMQLHPRLHVELVTIRTSGDRITDRPLAELGGKGLFTKEIEQALLGGTIDFAVHSYKDVPITMPLLDVSSLIIAAVPKREDPRDVLIVRHGLIVEHRPPSLDALPFGANVGTGSLRRLCQLAAVRPDLQIQSIRGNIDTRLRKLREGEHDAIILALAGLRRAELFDESCMSALSIEQMIPSPGQGALALQCRVDDERTISLLRGLHDADSAACVDAEREVVAALNGDCHSPIAALATIAGKHMDMSAALGEYDGVGGLRRAKLSDLALNRTGLGGKVADLLR